MAEAKSSNEEQRFGAVRGTVEERGSEAALTELADYFRAESRYHEFFETRLMLCRQRAGLPLEAHFQIDAMDSPLRESLEQSYLDACRETGRLFLQAGKIREAWMYLRTVDDRAAMRGHLAVMEVDAQNVESLLEIAIYEGVDVVLGFGHLLKEMGTCNAITTYESVMPTHSLEDRRLVAGLLIDHLHHELVTNFSSALGGTATGGAEATDALGQLLQMCHDEFGEYTVHVDASHLSSVVRMAEIVESEDVLKRAVDLTIYGKRLHQNFHFPGPAPFEDPYESHRLLFSALLGTEVEEAVAYFRSKAEAIGEQQNPGPAEVYVSLLARLGRCDEALAARIELIGTQRSAESLAPSLLELAERSGEYDRLLRYLESEDDLLTYAAAVIQQRGADSRE
ncbi:MAG: hypothetical protein P8K78_05280 [Pirellulales bacterium]|nr:hypothetical protein [Pirellulales bacterium]